MPPIPEPARLLVMLSGGGRTALNLLDAIDAGSLHARVVHAIASKPCVGADRLSARAISTDIIEGEISADHLQRLLTAHRVDFVALCGYLRYLHVPPAYEGRIINIHPSLLPKFGGKGFYGHRVHKAVLDANEPVSGCTVHLVDNQFDHGAIILQRSCPVHADDTPETLAARVFALECEAFPAGLQLAIDRFVSKSEQDHGANAPSVDRY